MNFFLDAVRLLHPGAQNGVEFLWIDRGKGFVLETWDEKALGPFDRKAIVAAEKQVAISLIKGEAARRIASTGLTWMLERELSGGKPVPDDVKEACAKIRAASDRLEKAIPDDIFADENWQ